MDERLIHRKAWFSQAVLAGIFLLQGFFASWSAQPVFAGNQDSIQIGVTPTDTIPPAAIADLLASANPSVIGVVALNWTSPQGNVGGVPIANWPVASYTVRYATFSVDSLSGNTALWWNSATTSVTLQPPSFTPKTPGQSEAYALSGLTAGTTIYFAIESISQNGIVSPIDSEASTPGHQAQVFIAETPTSTLAPMQPTGLMASVLGPAFTLNWHAVTTDTSGQPIAVDHYQIDRYASINSSPTLVVNVPASNTTYGELVDGQVFFYRIIAIATSGTVSAPSDYIDSSPQTNRYILAPDDPTTRVVIPGDLAVELNSENNVYKQDLEIRLVHRPQDEFNVTLRSYDIDAFVLATNQQLFNFAFSQAGISIQLGYGALLSSNSSSRLTPSQVVALTNASNTGAGSIAQIVSVYWFNGAGYIRVGDPVLTGAQSLSVTVKNLGIYQIRAVQISTQFSLTQGSPYPRVITPNDPSQNNRVFFFFDNPTDSAVSGAIYDIRGAKVRDLQMNSQSPTTNSLVWDGHDNSGRVVRTGVYIYKITAGSQSQTGTLVVAR